MWHSLQVTADWYLFIDLNIENGIINLNNEVAFFVLFGVKALANEDRHINVQCLL